MTKLILIAIAISFIAGYFTCYNTDSNDKQKTIRELATVICIANHGQGGCVDNE